jgi:TDG/mug DNA glycosylase family protein
MQPHRPTKQELEAARSNTVPDLIGAGLVVLFVGINPGLYSAAIGHHFGRPGNRFWPVLHCSGFTPRLLGPYEEAELLSLKIGITNIAGRATASAEELTATELQAGARVLAEKAGHFRPAWLGFVGIGAYRKAFGRPKATIGPQGERLEGAGLWVLPNTSGLNANYLIDQTVELFAEVRREAFGGA